MIRDYRLNDAAAAERFVARPLEEFDYLMDVVAGAWAEMEQTRAWQRMAIVRVLLLEYMSAAYALRDAKIFDNAYNTFLGHRLAKSCVMVPTRAQIAPDLALAVSRARMHEARDTCELVLSCSDLADDESAAAFCVDILAALIDLDYHRAEKSSTRLVQQCERKRFSKFECTLFAHWARAAEMVARRDDSLLNRQFKNIADVRRAHIDRGLVRWKSGQPTQLDATDFWDWLTTALASIAQSFGYKFETNAFADHDWTREVK